MRDQVGLPWIESAIESGGGPTYQDGRDALDRYYTPPWYVDLLLDNLNLAPGNAALEPFAGRALAISGRLAQRGYQVATADIDAGAAVDHHGDSFARDWRAAYPRGFDLVCTNPPFTIGSGATLRTAADAVSIFRPLARGAAAFLMRLTFLEPFASRVDLLKNDPPTQILVLPRYSFRGNGATDNVTCAWFIWRPWRSKESKLRTYSPDDLALYEERYKLDQRAREEEAKRLDFSATCP